MNPAEADRVAMAGGIPRRRVARPHQGHAGAATVRGMAIPDLAFPARARIARDGGPEYWRHDAGGDTVAVLDVPGLVGRARRFDVDASLLVEVPHAAQQAWLELAVEFDGRRQWSRRIAASNPGETDGLDYHQRVHLPAELGMRIRATAKVHGVTIRQLLLEAREEPDAPRPTAMAGGPS